MVAFSHVLCHEKERLVKKMKKNVQGFMIAGNLLTLAFIIGINVLFFPSNLWSIYPAIAILFSISFSIFPPSLQKIYSVLVTPLLMWLLFLVNHIESPTYIWAYYVFPILIMWPIAFLLGKKITTKTFSVVGALGLIAAYISLNIFYEPGFPWSIFPTFALLMWPLSRCFGKYPFAFSVASTGLGSLFFILTNYVTTPTTIWAIYPIFALLWWPLAIFFFVKKRK